tara:strand:- start:3568 stop:4167 length:600 start_codon:yes stop_codon:yes gene_type:complete
MKGYDYDLKKRMDINILLMDECLRDQTMDRETYMVRYKELTYMIKQLPREIQKYIYIFALKDYWKNQCINTPLVPLHIKYEQYLLKHKHKLVINNIHFLHLDFNTLPGNKEYILGCQCDFCYNYPREKKDELYNEVNLNKYKFLKTIHCGDDSFGNGVISLDYDDYEYTSYVKGYNFRKDAYYNPINEDPHESPIYFSQ